MKRIVSAVVFVMAAAGMVFGQAADTRKPSAGTPPTQDTEATLMKMERDAAAALMKRDVAGFGAIFADNATFHRPGRGGSDEGATARGRRVQRAGDSIPTEISDLKVRVFGESAVATYTTTDKGKYKDRDISGRYRWIDVFSPPQRQVANRGRSGHPDSVRTDGTTPMTIGSQQHTRFGAGCGPRRNPGGKSRAVRTTAICAMFARRSAVGRANRGWCRGGCP